MQVDIPVYVICLFQILAAYDMIVLVGCAALYSLPTHWAWYGSELHPRILPVLLPVVQIAMMTSVYCTIVMSFERYVRICRICQMRSSKVDITDDNIW